jgi:hypothetical protein
LQDIVLELDIGDIDRVVEDDIHSDKVQLDLEHTLGSLVDTVADFEGILHSEDKLVSADRVVAEENQELAAAFLVVVLVLVAVDSGESDLHQEVLQKDHDFVLLAVENSSEVAMLVAFELRAIVGLEKSAD